MKELDTTQTQEVTGALSLKFTWPIFKKPIKRPPITTLAVGEEGGPDHPSVWQMSVKSWITGPLDATQAGRVQVTGVAFGGTTNVASVEVSADDGQTWSTAEFIGPDLGKFAWRPFVAQMDLQPGTYRLVSRATDADGNQQPEQTEPNDPGYNHNGWRAPGIEIEVA